MDMDIKRNWVLPGWKSEQYSFNLTKGDCRKFGSPLNFRETADVSNSAFAVALLCEISVFFLLGTCCRICGNTKRRIMHMWRLLCFYVSGMKYERERRRGYKTALSHMMPILWYDEDRWYFCPEGVSGQAFTLSEAVKRTSIKAWSNRVDNDYEK